MRRAALLALTAGAIAAAPASAQTSVADFYRNKSIDVYIGMSAGGLYDINARLLARFMSRHIPGNPTLVPRNMVGAAGLRLANWLYQVAPKDGTAIGTFVRGIPFAPLLGEPGIAGDAAKFNWLGSPNDEVSVCASRRESGITTLAQVYDHELIVGSTGGSGACCAARRCRGTGREHVCRRAAASRKGGVHADDRVRLSLLHGNGQGQRRSLR